MVSLFPSRPQYHNLILIFSGTPCDEAGKDLPPHSPPPKEQDQTNEGPNWHPFNSCHDFDFTWYHFVECESSERQVNQGLDLWAASVLQHGGTPTWKSATELYDNIDKIQHGSAPWRTYSFCYSGPLPPAPPRWMTCTYELCTRDAHQVLQHQFANPDFKDKVNYTPYRQFNKAGKRIWSNFMSGDWAWKQAVSHNQFVAFGETVTYLPFRILLPRTLAHMAPSLSLSLVGVIRPRFPLRQDIKSIIQCISRLETSSTLHVEDMVWV